LGGRGNSGDEKRGGTLPSKKEKEQAFTMIENLFVTRETTVAGKRKEERRGKQFQGGGKKVSFEGARSSGKITL